MDHRQRVGYAANLGKVTVIKPVIARKLDNSSAGNPVNSLVQRVMEVVTRLGITMIQIEDWVILQRSKMDIVVNGEPYPALHLYINIKTRAFITRVWGRTHSKGDIGDLSEVDEICGQSFAQGGLVCCPGHQEVKDTDVLTTVEYPFRRMVALDCDVLHANSGGEGSIQLCRKCASSIPRQEKSDQCKNGENGDHDIVEVEVEAKFHEVITVEDEETTHPNMEHGKEESVNKPIHEPIDDSNNEPFEEYLVEDPIEDDIFTCSEAVRSTFCKNSLSVRPSPFRHLAHCGSDK